MDIGFVMVLKFYKGCPIPLALIVHYYYYLWIDENILNTNINNSKPTGTKKKAVLACWCIVCLNKTNTEGMSRRRNNDFITFSNVLLNVSLLYLH